MLFGSMILIALIGMLPFLPDKFPNLAIPIATVVATRLIVEKKQFTKQGIAESNALAFKSNWNVLWTSLSCLVAFFAVAMAAMLAMDHLGVVDPT